MIQQEAWFLWLICMCFSVCLFRIHVSEICDMHKAICWLENVWFLENYVGDLGPREGLPGIRFIIKQHLLFVMSRPLENY